MDEDTAKVLQVVAGVLAVAMIATTALITAEPENQNLTIAVLGSAFTLIAALLGVHYGVKIANGGG